MHTFEIKPSARLVTPGAQRDKEKVSQRYRPDELLFQWHNLPRDSEVEVHFSDIDTADIAALASYRNSPLACPSSCRTHIVTTIPPDDRWYPLIQRYVHHLGRKVDALGGDSSAVHPNPDGSGRPDHPTTDHEHPDEVTGLVEEILYDCDGGFIGFVLNSDCERHAFRHCETSVERLVLRACRERLRLKVVSDRDRIHRISILCCGGPDHSHDDD